MSEVKRTNLISLETERVNAKKQRGPPKTIRISVILPESTEDNNPEFNYKDELAAAKRKDSKNSSPKQTNGLDPFNEDDEDVKRIAAEMEAKYGVGAAKKNKWKKDDFADIGMGYDENDSFIDNADGYDEIIPKNVTTALGGFYINSGALEFKADENASSEPSSSDEEDTTEKPVNRKRVLESSAESEDEGEGDKSEKEDHHQEKKPKLLPNPNGMQKAIKKRLFSHDKIQQIKRKRAEETKKTVRELLRERREDLNITTEVVVPEKPEPATSPKENRKPTTLASVDDVIESVISGSAKTTEQHMDESSKDSWSSKDTGTNNKSASNSPEGVVTETVTVKPIEIVQLPENLPNEIIEIIDSIKKAAACNTEGKVKFFSGHVNTMLLNLERKCKCLGKQSRMKVYEHLAPFVKCRKETLMKRAKNLIVLEEQNKIRSLLDRLKAAVGLIMPSLVERYDEEVRKRIHRNQQPWEWYRCAWFSNNGDAMYSRMPKRHFSWTEETKKLLRDVVTLRKKCFLNEGKQKDHLEHHIVEFLETEVLTIWPKDWVSLNMLIKCCGHVFEIKKTIDPQRKSTPTSLTDISLNTTPPIPISPNSALTITPVTSNVQKPSVNELKAKPKPITLNDTTISKINSDSSSIIKSLPPAEIVKTSIDPNNVKSNSVTITPSSINSNKLVATVKDDPNEITFEENPIDIQDVKKEEPENLSTEVQNLVKKEEPEDLSAHMNTTIKSESNETSTKDKDSTNHCQVIDLTDQPELKKRPGPKSKTKYLYEYPDKPPKLKKEISEHIRSKSKEEITGSSAFTQIIADSLNDYHRFAQSTVISTSSNSTAINSTAPITNPPEPTKIANTNTKKISTSTSNSSYDYAKAKPSSEGDDIQRVMEGLKVLQKMSSPIKPSDDVKTSSPVSVIAFSKSYTQDADRKPHNTNLVTHRTTNSFQDAFQKQFIPDFNLMKASQNAQTPSTSKGSYNSISKHNYPSTPKISLGLNDRYMQNSNNSYLQQSSNKVKNNCSSQQSGSYNLLDDMFANFLSEYGHSKAANSKSNTQHK